MSLNDKTWEFNSSYTCDHLAAANDYADSSVVPSGYTLQDAPMMINRCATEIEGCRAWLTARPSSNHPGCVVMGMVDGSVRVVNEQVEKLTYISAMAPYDKKSRCTELREHLFQVSDLDI